VKQISLNNNQTEAIGQELSRSLKGGDILLLRGELGAGKTTFVKGIARGLGIKKSVTSPSFALMNLYKIKNINLVHIDTYRLKNEQELVDIGVEDYLGAPENICIVEWPEKIAGLLRDKKTISVEIAHINEKTREITLLNPKSKISNHK
jgi:tRNA threonylcarbamoyladenosine biosynthesis protein TsaE